MTRAWRWWLPRLPHPIPQRSKWPQAARAPPILYAREYICMYISIWVDNIHTYIQISLSLSLSLSPSLPRVNPPRGKPEVNPKERITAGEANPAAKWAGSIYSCIHLYRWMYTHTHVYIYIYTYISTYLYTYIYICTCISVYIQIYIYVHICTYTYIYTYMYKHIYIYIWLKHGDDDRPFIPFRFLRSPNRWGEPSSQMGREGPLPRPPPAGLGRGMPDRGVRTWAEHSRKEGGSRIGVREVRPAEGGSG